MQVMVIVMWVEETYVILSGDLDHDGVFLRPIVSIDLKSSGYKMTTSVDEKGKMTVSLSTE